MTAPVFGSTKSNQSRSEESRERLTKALEAPTLNEAVEAYGKSRTSFWRAAKRLGMHGTVTEKYSTDLAAQRANSIRASLAARAVKPPDTTDRDALIEDAEFLAKTGETQDGAVRRLGFQTWNSLYKRLAMDYGRTDITDRLTSNMERPGSVRSGYIYHHGARL